MCACIVCIFSFFLFEGWGFTQTWQSCPAEPGPWHGWALYVVHYQIPPSYQMWQLDKVLFSWRETYSGYASCKLYPSPCRVLCNSWLNIYGQYLILLWEYEMCQSPVIVDYKHFSVFPKLSIAHGPRIAQMFDEM